LFNAFALEGSMPFIMPLGRTLPLTLGCALFGLLPASISPHSPRRFDDGLGQVLPTARQVVARYDSALGGVDALRRHTSATLRGTAEFHKPDSVVRVPFVTLMRAPYFRLDTFTLPGKKGEDLSGFDGAIAWHVAPGAAPEIITGNARESVKRDADFYYALTELSWFKSMETVGIEQFEGHSCYHLHGITNWGQSNNQFYDRETGLLVGYEFDNMWRGAPALDHEVFSDYVRIEGVLVPMKQTSKAKPKDGVAGWTVVQTLIYTSVTFNNVDSSVFTPPRAVRDLLAKHKPA
jgi:hypothetical protein